MANQLDAVFDLEAMGRAGITISICCGPVGPSDVFGWSVMAMRGREEFETPFAVESFAHAVEIARLEARKRGWLP